MAHFPGNSLTPDKEFEAVASPPTRGTGQGGGLSDFQYFALPLVLFIVGVVFLFGAGFVCFLISWAATR